MASMDATASRHVNGELYCEHRGEARGLQAHQYAYGIGSYHYNWTTTGTRPRKSSSSSPAGWRCAQTAEWNAASPATS